MFEIEHTIILVYSYADIVNNKLFHIIWRSLIGSLKPTGKNKTLKYLWLMAVIFTISIYRKSDTLIGIIILITCHNL